MRIRSPLAIALVLAAPTLAAQQTRWREIGRTNIGNAVLLDRRSVARAKGITTATLRVAFAKPVKSPRGEITSSRTIVMLDCARRVVAIRENTYYHDEKAGRVYEHKVVKLPGYAAPFAGSMPDVAMAHLCPR